MTRAFIFPGQGSQFIGMGKELAESYSEAREVFEEVDDALGQKLSALMFDGDEAELGMTENTQPALMAVSVAAMRALEKRGGFSLSDKASFVAGHSLGEYSALTAAGSFALADAARILRLRGQAMQRAVPVGVGSMAAIIGPPLEDVRDIAEAAAEGQICAAANDNSVGQVVISGHKEAVARAVEIASDRGAKRAVILPVSAPFHCELMAPAAEAMAEALAEIEVKAPSVPVVANVIAQGTQDAEQIKMLLVEQVTGAVRWRESVIWMKEQGVGTLYEIGAGKVLSGLVRRIDRDIECKNAGSPQEIEALLEALS